ncbi:MAG: hypothetical protein ABJE95_06745 [Byssovorax sp.]
MVGAPDGGAAIWTIFEYMCAVDETRGPEELLRLVASEVGKDVEEVIVTTADILREQGRTKGRSEGRSEGLSEGLKGQRVMLLKLLSQRFGELPEVTVARVNAAGPLELEAWFDRGLTAATLDEVLGEG